MKKKNSNTRSVREPLDHKIMKYVESQPGKHFSRKKIFKKFTQKYPKEEVEKALDKLSSKGKMEVAGSKLIAHGKRPSGKSGGNRIVEAVLDMTKFGYAFAVCKDLEHDVFISSTRLNRALDGDTVKVRITNIRRNGKLDGEVIEILKRGHTQFIGTVHVHESFAFLIPDRRNMMHDIFIPLDKLNGAQTGQKALAEITKWPEDSKSPVGKITEILGASGLNDVEMKSILIENGFPLNFSSEAMKEADAISDIIDEREIAKREDFRNITTFTIDPEDAKDFDDALSLKKLDNGNWEVGVHIADVTHYLKPGTPLDKEAYDRATSVYLVDRVNPMLPKNFLMNCVLCVLTKRNFVLPQFLT